MSRLTKLVQESGLTVNPGGEGSNSGNNSPASGGAPVVISAPPPAPPPVVTSNGEGAPAAPASGQGTPGINIQPTIPPALPADDVILKSIFGETEFPVKTISEIGGAFTTLKQLTTDKETLTQRITELEPADAYVAGLNKALKSGITKEHFDAAQRIDSLSGDKREALVLFNMMKDKLSREKAEFYVDDTYKLGPEFEAMKDTREVKIAEIQLQKDFNTAMEYLGQHKVNLLTSPADSRKAAMETAWKPVQENVLGGLKLEIQLEGETLSFPMTDELKKSALEAYNALMEMPGFNLLPEGDGIAKLQETLQLGLIKDNFPKIVKFIENRFKVKYVTDKHTPASITGESGGNINKEQTDEEALGDQLVDTIRKSRGLGKPMPVQAGK